MSPTKTGGGIGTNQYGVRGHSKQRPEESAPHVNLIAQIQGQELSKECGEIWGGNCHALVGPPNWSHGKHGVYDKKLRRLSPDPTRASNILDATFNPIDFVDRKEQLQQACVSLVQECEVPQNVVSYALSVFPRLTGDQLTDCWSHVRLSSDSDLIAFTRQPNCPSNILVELAKKDNPRIAVAAVSHPSFPSSVLASVIEEKEPEAQLPIALTAFLYCKDLSVQQKNDLESIINSQRGHPDIGSVFDWSNTLNKYNPDRLMDCVKNFSDTDIRDCAWSVAARPECPSEFLTKAVDVLVAQAVPPPVPPMTGTTVLHHKNLPRPKKLELAAVLTGYWTNWLNDSSTDSDIVATIWNTTTDPLIKEKAQHHPNFPAHLSMIANL